MGGPAPGGRPRPRTVARGGPRGRRPPAGRGRLLHHPPHRPAGDGMSAPIDAPRADDLLDMLELATDVTLQAIEAIRSHLREDPRYELTPEQYRRLGALLSRVGRAGYEALRDDVERTNGRELRASLS